MKFLFIALIAIPFYAIAQTDAHTDIITATEAVSKIIGKDVKYILMTNDTIDHIEVLEDGKIVKYSGEKLQKLIVASTKLKRREVDKIAKRAFDEEFERLLRKGRQ